MPSTIGSICAKLIATTDAWLASRRHQKVVRLVERLILAHELESNIWPIAAKLHRCNQKDVAFELGIRMMMHSEEATLGKERANDMRDPLDLATVIKSWQAMSDADIASARHASTYGAALAYDQILRIKMHGLGLF